MSSVKVWISESTDRIIHVAGDLTEESAPSLVARLHELQVPPGDSVHIDMRELDIEDGLSLALIIDVLRELKQRNGRLTLIAAPQMLAHNLYRVGLLEPPEPIKLIEMREDEPSGS